MKWLLEFLSCIHWWNPLIYLMKKEYALTPELANDHRLLREHPDYNCTDYAELILKIAKAANGPHTKYTGRIDRFCKKAKFRSGCAAVLYFKRTGGKGDREKASLGPWDDYMRCNVFSLFIVIEPSFPSPPIDKSGTFEMDPDNTYFIHSAGGYEIYVEGQSVGMAYELPENF